MTRPAALALSVAAYAAAVLSANYLTAHYGLVSAGFGLLVTAGTYAAGLALLARDFVHRYGGTRWAVTAVLIGAVLSYFLANHALALASAVAFLTAELVDLLVFVPVRARAGFLAGSLASNVVSAPVDTVVFLAIAGFPLTAEAITGQFVAKVLWSTIAVLAVYTALAVRSRRDLAAA